jgi:hypothetical protein
MCHRCQRHRHQDFLFIFVINIAKILFFSVNDITEEPEDSKISIDLYQIHTNEIQ